jgi:hypothetical protein
LALNAEWSVVELEASAMRAPTGGASHTWVHVRKDLGAGDFAPDVARAHFAKVDFVLHLGLNVLHMAIQHWHRYDREQGGDGRNGHTEEGDTAHSLGFSFSSLWVVHG